MFLAGLGARIAGNGASPAAVRLPASDRLKLQMLNITAPAFDVRGRVNANHTRQVRAEVQRLKAAEEVMFYSCFSLRVT